MNYYGWNKLKKINLTTIIVILSCKDFLHLKVDRKKQALGDEQLFKTPDKYVYYIFLPRGGGGGGGGGEGLGSSFAGYVPLASQNPYSIIVSSVANYRLHLSYFWANVTVISRTEFNASRLLNIKTAGTTF